MTDEAFWTIVFGLIATVIGCVTIWQNSQVIEVKDEGETNDIALQLRLTFD